MSVHFYPKLFDSKQFEDQKERKDNLYELVMECTDENFDFNIDDSFTALAYYPSADVPANFATVLSEQLELDLIDLDDDSQLEEVSKTIEILNKIGSVEKTNLDWETYEPYIGFITLEESITLKGFLEKYNFDDDVINNYKHFMLEILRKAIEKNKGIIILAF
ncbi:hypothetical protein KJ596_02505 [Patescibacteria group bacterium]|nr:hypothetical protein [Patescibacteria group bacterium]MBU1868662.1 hypothetical protein [Patescibacteria group bacterium]